MHYAFLIPSLCGTALFYVLKKAGKTCMQMTYSVVMRLTITVIFFNFFSFFSLRLTLFFLSKNRLLNRDITLKM